MQLTIGWLYPKQMSTYGDRGNILTLQKRCQWRNIGTRLIEIEPESRLESGKIDLYFFGGGQDQAQEVVAKDLKKFKKSALLEDAGKGAVFLSICGGYQLLGKYYQPFAGAEIEGIGILDVHTIAGKKRLIGNVAIESNPLLLRGKLIGFENHSGKTYLGKAVEPLGKIIIGGGNNGEDRTEGAWRKNIFGCYLHGPLLPKNPRFADLLIERALQYRWGDVGLTPLDDKEEIAAHESSFQRAKIQK
ncbi:MAG: glutamine amidotransferase [Candidatus Woykebacteria bacterium RIFCSPHIGHO2_12_FULL_45_10]|uniref:Lipid II isoglutaminyl synthase (glutamine-hydrolyzing) subunit GatD n=1 Tax=Candidatus Woykebacteria bacterium RIFCSPHIGHO2_12_FULL_45_10 TaxID=1802603 RepID=A0A1G1WP37_9BACT|nr:MAG: glutamine amidotransferase [Candidatus Woykebacteria bacterium RIFCSPHIGHO2_12_FULL_45_10]